MNQDAAFDLVKSLTPNEKRFFRLQSGEDKNYLYVFDALDVMKAYDAEVLKKKLRNRKINISYEKNYLIKQILKVLRMISSGDSPLLQANSLVADVELLYAKRLFTQALQKINEAKQLTKKFDFWGIYLELLSVQKRILILAPAPEIEKIFAQMEEEQAHALALLNNLHEYISLNSRMHAVAMAGGGLMAEKDVALFKKLTATGIMSDEKYALSANAKMLFHAIKMGVSFFSGDLEGALLSNNNCIRTVEENPPLFEKNPQNYISQVTNSCIIMMNSKRYSEARSILNKMREIEHSFEFKPSYTVRADIFENCVKMEIAIASESGTIENITALTREITLGLQEFKKGISGYDNLIITYYLAFINYFDGKVSLTQKILNDIVNEKSKKLAADYYLHCNLLLALIHFEKGNYDLAAKILKGLKQEDNKLARFITGFVNNKKNEVHSERERKAVYENFRAEAEQWLKENQPIVFFPLLKWIDTKL